MRFAVEYFLRSVNGVSDDNDLGHIFFNTGLVDIASDGEQFHFCACYKCCMIVRRGSHRGGSLQNGLGDERTCGMTLASAYVLRRLSAAWSQLQMKERESKWE